MTAPNTGCLFWELTLEAGARFLLLGDQLLPVPIPRRGGGGACQDGDEKKITVFFDRTMTAKMTLVVMTSMSWC